VNQEQGMCISICDVPHSLDKTIIWLKEGKVVEYLRNKRNGYYFVSDGNDDYNVFLDEEFHKYFKLLDVFRNEKIDQIL
jgi:hypothetical protein